MISFIQIYHFLVLVHEKLFFCLFIVPVNIQLFSFGPHWFVLILEKYVDIKIDRCNIHFGFYFERLKSNIKHIIGINL